MDELRSAPQALIPIWTERTDNQALDQMRARPVLVDVETLHATMRGEVTEICSTSARVLPVGPFFLWKNTEVQVRFRFKDVLYTLYGLTGVTDADNSFCFEFDLVSRRRMQVFSGQLKDAGLLRGNEAQVIAKQQEEQLAAALAEQHESDKAKAEPVKYSSGGSNRRVHSRFSLAAPANLLVINGGAIYRCAVVELSLGGCRVQTTRPLNHPALTRVEVQFVGLGLPLRLPAQIQVKINDHLAGLKYLEVSPRIRERLSILIDELTLKDAPRD